MLVERMTVRQIPSMDDTYLRTHPGAVAEAEMWVVEIHVASVQAKDHKVRHEYRILARAAYEAHAGIIGQDRTPLPNLVEARDAAERLVRVLGEGRVNGEWVLRVVAPDKTSMLVSPEGCWRSYSTKAED